MDFFKQLSVIADAYDLNMTFKKEGEQITLCILPTPKNEESKKLKKLKPLNLTGTADELDAEFFTAIQKPLEMTKGLVTNLASYQEQVTKVEEKAKEEATKKSTAKSSQTSSAKKKKKPLGPKEQALEHIKTGNKFFREKDYPTAMAEYLSAQKLTPKDPTLGEKIMQCRVKIKASEELGDKPAEKRIAPVEDAPGLEKEEPIVEENPTNEEEQAEQEEEEEESEEAEAEQEGVDVEQASTDEQEDW